MNRKWLYNYEKGGKIFDITTEEYKNAVSSGEWFNRPNEVIEHSETQVVEHSETDLQVYTKTALSRMTEECRIEIAGKFGVSISGMLRAKQIETILKAQNDSKKTD